MNGNSADGMDTRWINMQEQKQAKRILLNSHKDSSPQNDNSIIIYSTSCHKTCNDFLYFLFFLNESQWGPALF